jgi:hypothetical protein
VTYLLDVNALLALGCVKHVHHGCIQQWLQCAQTRAHDRSRLARSACIFLGDGLDVDQLPRRVTKSGQTTDGHLLELAAAHAARLGFLLLRLTSASVPAIPRWRPFGALNGIDQPAGRAREAMF